MELCGSAKLLYQIEFCKVVVVKISNNTYKVSGSRASYIVCSQSVQVSHGAPHSTHNDFFIELIIRRLNVGIICPSSLSGQLKLKGHISCC